MKTLFVMVALFGLAGATAASAKEHHEFNLADGLPSHGCQYKPTKARQQTEVPPAASAAPNEKPLVIAAVYKEISKCPVLVMALDPKDIRPVPKVSEGPARLQPAGNR